MKSRILLGVLFSFILAGCTPRVLIPVYRPWTRTAGSLESVTPGAIRIECDGMEEALVGGNEVIDQEYVAIVKDLLERRGFIVTDENVLYVLRITYRSQQRDALYSSTSVSARSATSSTVAASSGSGAASSGGSALGVALASLLGVSSAGSASTVSQTTGSEIRYANAIALVISDSDGEELWKGEASWSSRNPDILGESYLPLQFLIAELPSVDAPKPHVRRVKLDRVKTFYRLYCLNRWFSSPAVPYRIRFDGFKSTVNSQEAYLAYLDLLETAEYALPIGDDDYSEVTDSGLWDEVMLGGEYLLGPIKEHIKVLITIETNREGGYDVIKAKLATNSEYQDFQSRMETWRSALRYYYNIFD